MKLNGNNERVKRRYFDWLKESEGFSSSTIDCIVKAINQYEHFTGYKDFSLFNSGTAVEYKKWLEGRKHNDKPVSLATSHSYLRNLKKFFSWLSWQPGYKSRITPDKVSYLKLSAKNKRIATQFVPRNYPGLEYVQKLINSITINNEVDNRDRALIAFTLLTGMRDTAIATLPLGCVDEKQMRVIQDPKLGVKTKFSKYILSVIFNFDDTLVKYFFSWINYLKTKGFGTADPVFPRTKSVKNQDGLCFIESGEIEREYWKSANSIRTIFKERATHAGLPYFQPHTFRHLAIDLALKGCRNGEHMKAISQNFGHENIATTLTNYANYEPQRLSEIMKTINFTPNKTSTKEEIINLINKLDI